MSIRLEAAQPSQEHEQPGGQARARDVEVADGQRVGERQGDGNNLAETGGEKSEERVPGDAREVATDEHEAGGGVDDAEQAGEEERGWDEAERQLHQR